MKAEQQEKWVALSKSAEFQEHHFQNIEDVGIAWCGNRLWICLNGGSLLRAKVQGDKFSILYSPETFVMLQALAAESGDLTCPFCQNTDFDGIGLKLHLSTGGCDDFNDIEIPARWRGLAEKATA